MSKPRPHKWSLDLYSRKGTNDRSIQPVTDLPAPPGFSLQKCDDTSAKTMDAELITKKNWDIALAPIKQIPMNLFMMFMAGNAIGIFSIMMIGMMFINPVRAIMNIQATWKTIEGPQAYPQRFILLLGNLLCACIAVYKCHSMGLLPTHASDWLLFSQPLERIEFSAGAAV